MHWAFWRPREPEPFLPAYVQPRRSRWFSGQHAHPHGHAHHAQQRVPNLARGGQTGYYYTYPPPGHGAYGHDYAYAQGYGGHSGWDQGQAPLRTGGGRYKTRRTKVMFGPATVRVVR